ncbi:hypothetical protein ABZ297_27110 [Nonomuraea sp. NPDC005983]|uniref:hypothetical protein n=1 Tax=Nonomuraea sp. NPDC005983 TaxID=3155595 RepID=UPI0033B774B8
MSLHTAVKVMAYIALAVSCGGVGLAGYILTTRRMPRFLGRRNAQVGAVRLAWALILMAIFVASITMPTALEWSPLPGLVALAVGLSAFGGYLALILGSKAWR